MRPLVEEILPPPDPVQCCERLAGLPHRLFLDSAAGGSRLGRYSFLTADPVDTFTSTGGGDALDAVRVALAQHAADPVDGLPPFQGGAAGYIAYDWGRSLETLPASRFDDLAMPDVVLGLYDWVLAWDHEEGRAWLISTGIPEIAADARARRAAARAAEVRGLISGQGAGGQGGSEGISEGIRIWPPGPLAPLPPDQPPKFAVSGGWWPSSLDLRSSFTHAAYVEAVARVREYILAGDIFQANLSQRFEAPLREPAWSLYRRLRTRNAAPFAAFFDLPDATILSASPERFLRLDADRHVQTRPIKGTRPRGVGPEHDAALGQALTESAKDRAENLMIVDLMRNDLSRICLPGSVRVQDLFALERYATVHHLVSTVVGDLAPGADAVDLLRATFPGGSITGAPKLRAMEIITELEPSARGVYCGSIGYLSVTGAMDTSIAIRTVVVRHGRIYFSAGGGITAGSDPEQEYRETLDKARGIIDVLESA
jgi:para-aminobenzoate synthetase component 1